MSNFTVGLDVRNFASSGTDGYTNTTASNNAIYSYLYSGGSDGHGGVNETTGAGSGTITVQVGGDPRYSIHNVGFNGDIEGQLSWAPGNTSTTAVITDTDTSSGSGYYSVVVADSSANCTFTCDPPINHQPG